MNCHWIFSLARGEGISITDPLQVLRFCNFENSTEQKVVNPNPKSTSVHRHCRCISVSFWRFPATQLLEEETKVPVVKDSLKDSPKTDEARNVAPSSTTGTDVNMQDAKIDYSAAKTGLPESGDKVVNSEIDVKVDAPKKKVKKINVPVSKVVYGVLAAANVHRAVEELEMALHDRVMEETKDRKNPVNHMCMKCGIRSR